MAPELTTLAIDDELIPIVAIVGAFAVAIVWAVFSSMVCICRSRDLERSRREIAAYVAEGTISPEEGERILNAGDKPNKRCL